MLSAMRYQLAALIVTFIIAGLFDACGGSDSTRIEDLEATITALTDDASPEAPIIGEATPTATVVSLAATRMPDRLDCAAIRGTDYRSPAEREWFLANCLPPTLAPPAPTLSPAPPPPPSGLTVAEAIDVATAWMNAEDFIWPFSGYSWSEAQCSARRSIIPSEIPSGDTGAWRVSCVGESLDPDCLPTQCSRSVTVCVFDPSESVLSNDLACL